MPGQPIAPNKANLRPTNRRGSAQVGQGSEDEGRGACGSKADFLRWDGQQAKNANGSVAMGLGQVY